MAKAKYFGAAIVLLISNVALASSYNCTVKQYVSEQSEETSDVIEPFSVEVNRAGDPVPAEFRQAGSVAWSVTRYDGLISAELRDSQGQSISISTTSDGEPLGVKVISEKQILTCNPVFAEGELLPFNHKAFGDIDSLTVNPKAYGETMTYTRKHLDLQSKEVLQRYLELHR